MENESTETKKSRLEVKELEIDLEYADEIQKINRHGEKQEIIRRNLECMVSLIKAVNGMREEKSPAFMDTVKTKIETHIGALKPYGN